MNERVVVVIINAATATAAAELSVWLLLVSIRCPVSHCLVRGMLTNCGDCCCIRNGSQEVVDLFGNVPTRLACRHRCRHVQSAWAIYIGRTEPNAVAVDCLLRHLLFAESRKY